MMASAELMAFEEEMKALFLDGKIKSPLHLAGGNEADLIAIFEEIKPEDWVLCTWRSHYHCLLKGVPPDELKDAIIRGRSIGLCFAKYRVLSSAIVGGIAPIAVGLAWSIKRRGGSERVYCFLGDMACTAGIVHEARQYSGGHDLPVTWVIEDNDLSVNTKTADVWGRQSKLENYKFQYYSYKLRWPHVGIGKWVAF
jgi:TPP-dependent pyruvate/acetoin dehydrogenase alpha subunit